MNPFAGLITPMQDRPCVERRERLRNPAKPKAMRREQWSDHPLGLSAGMCAALDALIETGSEAQAGEKLGLTVSTVSTQINRARERMGLANRLLVVLAYDRWVRAHRGDV